MEGKRRMTVAVAVGFALMASPAPAQMIILSSSDDGPEVAQDNIVFGLMRDSLVAAGYRVHWIADRLPEGEEGPELVFQVVDTDQGFDATFVLSDLYHDPDAGMIRSRPMILYQFHAYDDVRDIGDDAAADFLQRLEEEKALAEAEEEAP